MDRALARADRRLEAESRRPPVLGLVGTLDGEPLDGRGGPFLSLPSVSFWGGVRVFGLVGPFGFGLTAAPPPDCRPGFIPAFMQVRFIRTFLARAARRVPGSAAAAGSETYSVTSTLEPPSPRCPQDLNAEEPHHPKPFESVTKTRCAASCTRALSLSV